MINTVDTNIQEIPNFNEYLGLNNNVMHQLKLICFNANGLTKDIKNRAYSKIFEPNTIVLVGDTMMTTEKLSHIEGKAKLVGKIIFAKPNRILTRTGGTLICLPKIFKDEPVYLDDNEDGISLVAFTDYDNRKKLLYPYILNTIR